ncbi:MAG: TonB-dependent receptor plug domain-containing protein [Bacteroidetes bacterium]|nr:TonB-dependent receptor plug domain-containing protein [Bacteroidota bacterium]
MGKNTLSIESIRKLPSFLGEVDVVKGLISLPGVSTVGEGASGFNVRGGGVDQNLILQDGALIFNPSHVFGFFSAFNPEMVKNATLYKSGIPASYGGRLSSVLDVELKEGNLQEYHVDGGLGLISSKLIVNGPIIKNKMSFIIGGRMSYSDWLLDKAKDINVKNSSASFRDFNSKITYLPGNKDKISYSNYLSHDSFSFASDTLFEWNTTNHILTWDHIFTDKLFSQTYLVAGRYNYSIRDDEGFNSFVVKSKINYQAFKTNFEYDVNDRYKLHAGGDVNLFQFEPGKQFPIGESSGVESLQLEHEKSVEAGLFIENEYQLHKAISIKAGLRYSMFYNRGPGNDFIYAENAPRNNFNITDTVSYSSGDLIKSYKGLEPRITLNYEINLSTSLKLSYNRTRQYLHLITNTTAVTPTDLWKTSNRYIPPEIGDQYSIGLFKNWLSNSIETSVEVYYKNSDNIVDFKNGSKLLMNRNIDADLITGNGKSYGTEFYLNKKIGRLTGWFSYTYSRTFRKIEGQFSEETINNGSYYPANFDKPHDLSLALNYKISHYFEFGSSFTYNSGRPFTVPLSLYGTSNLTSVSNFSQRNEQRIPDYHRLDLSIKINSREMLRRRLKYDVTFALYNVYARKNAYTVFFRNNIGEPPKAYKLSVLGATFPAIIVNFHF